jgi:transcriptional regulator with XRE-family HTH domain
MTDHQVPFGVLLRRWRVSRRMTQAELALAASSSTRHLSCIETGRSQPSRDMILRLCDHLDVPLRDQNALLLAAGFAPMFRERSLDDLTSARLAMDRILQAHLPYPAFALDRHWNVVLSNGALPQLYEGCSPEFLQQPINAVRLIHHPMAMASRIVNLIEWRAHTIALLRRQCETRPDPTIQALLGEVMSYPAAAGAMALATDTGPQRYATPLVIATRLGEVSFLSTTTVFGTPTDVTLSELALEMLFPANEATVAIVNAMVEENAAQSSQEVRRQSAG